ncbi:MAG: M1 family metallopeptidase [Actinomycetota bacterium]|nr:M1 family metallopeptidase [Actinomycetota bacterium]
MTATPPAVRALVTGLLCLPLVACTDSSGLARPERPEPGPGPSPTQSPVGGQVPEDLDAARSQPVADPVYPGRGEPTLDTLHYHLDLDWDVSTTTLNGVATITFGVTETREDVTFDLDEPLDVTAAVLDGTEVDTRRAGDTLTVATGQPLSPGGEHTLVLSYDGVPETTGFPGSRSDIAGLGWTTMQDGSVWTMQEPFGALTWYPVNDQPGDKAYYDATITSNGGFTNVFNGSVVHTDTDGDTTTTSWHVAEPAASYLVTVAIGDYEAIEDEGSDGLPVTYWVEPDSNAPMHYLEETPDMLAYLDELLGPYPFETAGLVVVPSASAMETQETTTIGEALFLADEVRVRGVLLHEYAHQWLGNTVTPDNWHDLWLNEGLATYVQLMWEDSVGLTDFDSTIGEWEARDQADRVEYGPPGAFLPGEFASINVYYSGAVMLHRIRGVVGDDAFFETLRAWPQENVNASVDHDDFIEFWSESTGTELTRFVDAWLTSGTTPSGGP